MIPRSLVSTLCAATIGVSGAHAQDATALREDTPITREIGPDQTHTFSVQLRASQFVVGEADQHDIDVVVRITGPDGEEIAEFDSPARGPEPFSFSTTTDGTYHIVVASFDDDETGNYTIRLDRVEAVATTREGRVDQLFAAWDRPGSPGAAVAIAQNGRILYEAGYGEAQLEYGIPIEPTTIFHVASVSKQFTAFAVAMLADQGRLSLDDDIRTHLPELPHLGATVTIRHLLHHTSGWRDQWALLGLAGWRLDDVITRDQILRLLTRQRELNFPPGSEYLYSNSGYTMAAEIVARVTGQSFADWTREHLFEPLGMTRTHFHDDHEMLVSDRAYSYAYGDRGLRKSVLSYANAGATSLFTTSGDLARWMHNLETGTVGGPEVLRMVHTRGVLTSGDTIDYALGLGHGEFKGLATVSHGGGDAGFRMSVLRFPEHALSVTVLSNLASFNPGRLTEQVAEIHLDQEIAAAEAAATAEPEAPQPARIEVRGELLDAYQGDYELAGVGLRITFTRDGDDLLAQPTDQQQSTLTAESDSAFTVPQVGARIVFLTESSGVVNRFQLTQGGQTLTGHRLGTAPPVMIDLAEYAGTYDSAELETSYHLVVRNDTLSAEHVRHDPITFARIGPDRFRGNVWFFGPVVFERDAEGAVTGMRVSNGRVRNLQFVRRGESEPRPRAGAGRTPDSLETVPANELPMIIVLNGPLGIGKSTLAEALAESIDQCVMLDGDQLIAANPPPPDEIEYLHSTIALLIAHHRRFGYRHFVIDHLWRTPAELAALRRRLIDVDADADIRCFRLTLPLDENLRRIERRQSARALDEQGFERRTVAEERETLFKNADSDLGEPFDVSAPTVDLVSMLLLRLGMH